MSLSANTNVASTVANYFSDNYQALLQAGTAVPATATTASSIEAFNTWKATNSGKQFFLEKSGDSSYKLSSVTGDASKVPAGAVPVGLNVAYAIESKELSLTDWTMARISDEIRLANAQEAFGSALSFAPEADVSFDPSSMSQADLMQLLRRLGQARSDLKTATALGNASDRQNSAAALGLSATLLGAAMEQQRLFNETVPTLATRSETTTLESAQSKLNSATGADGAAQSVLTDRTGARETADTKLAGKNSDLAAAKETLKAAQAVELSAQSTFESKSKALEDAIQARATADPDNAALLATLDAEVQLATTAKAGADNALKAAQSAVTLATAAVSNAQLAVDDAKEAQAYAKGQETMAADAANLTSAALSTATTEYNQAKGAYDQVALSYAVMSAALTQLVAASTSNLEAAQLAYNETAASTVSSSTLSGLTSAAGGALNSRLKSAADVALLTNPAVSLFSALDVQQTDDGYVINTSGMSTRETQKAAVRAALEEALSDPALQTALADAMAANADSLGTADMALPDQTRLYNEVAAAMISAMRSNDGYLDELASNAVDFGTQLSQMLGNELVSASKRDNALLSAMN